MFKIRAVKLNKKRFFTIFILALLFCFVLFFGRTVFLKLTHPLKYTEEVEKYSAEYNVDSKLVYALIKVESGFNPEAVSSFGAKGLMQIMDDTAEWCEGEMGIDISVPKDLFKPEVNINIGAWYLRYLLDHYDGNTELAITAYNGGPGNVSKWLKDPEYSDGKGGLSDIPYSETRNYIRKVQNAYDIYKEIY